MHDLAALEAKGIPCVALVSSAFRNQAAVQSRNLGYEGARIVFVEHPISDQTTEQLLVKAASVVDDVEGALNGTLAVVNPEPVTEFAGPACRRPAKGEKPSCATTDE